MANAYLWVKTFHIVLITSWFAGLFYLPRIFVNLADEKNPQVYARLLLMSDRLFRFMTILSVPAVLLGLILWLYFGIGAGDIWMHAKGVPGSHVIIKVKDKVPTETTIKRVAMIAAKNSKSTEDMVKVVYCKKKYVKKEPGMNTGQVKVDYINANEIIVPKN